MATSKEDKFAIANKKNELYSDFLNNLNPHPVSGAVMRVVNENAVTRSIKNLILTNKSERLYQPDIGSSVRKLLFEPMSSATATTLSSVIQETINTYEPRAKLINVVVTPVLERNLYTVDIVYMIINRQEPISVNVTLTRVR